MKRMPALLLVLVLSAVLFTGCSKKAKIQGEWWVTEIDGEELDFYGHKLKLTYDDGKLRLKDAGHVLIFEKKK